MIGYVVLGVAVLFVGALLYGTWRRQEAFTTMKGNYPPWVEIQKQVRAIFDKYYEYDLSVFAKIKETDVFATAKKTLDNVLSGGFGNVQVALCIQDPTKLGPQTKDEFARKFQTFLPSGFVVDMVNSPITTQMGVLEGARKYLLTLVKSYNPKNPGTTIPVASLVSDTYVMEMLSVNFKNAIIRDFIAVAFQEVNPKPKTS